MKLAAIVAFLASVASPPEPLLDWLYQAKCARPVQFWGYSFADTPEEMAQMAAEGANAVGAGLMWIPVHGQGPFGLSHTPGGIRDSGLPLGQRFRASQPFDRLRVTTPTWGTSSSGCELTLYRCQPTNLKAEAIASLTIRNAVDNAGTPSSFLRVLPGTTTGKSRTQSAKR